MPKSETRPRDFAILFVAALLFANEEDATDSSMARSFESAERFVAAAETRMPGVFDP